MTLRASATGTPLAIERLTREPPALEREAAALERDRWAGHAGKELEPRIARIHARLFDISAEQAVLNEEHGRQRQCAEHLRTLRDRISDDTLDGANLAELGRARQAFEAARKGNALTSLEVGAIEVASVIADWTGIPVSSMTGDEIANLLDLSGTMSPDHQGPGSCAGGDRKPVADIKA